MLFFIKYFCQFCVLILPFIELARRLVVKELKHKMIERIFLTKKTQRAPLLLPSQNVISLAKKKVYTLTKLLEYLKCFLLFDV